MPGSIVELCLIYVVVHTYNNLDGLEEMSRHLFWLWNFQTKIHHADVEGQANSPDIMFQWIHEWNQSVLLLKSVLVVFSYF